LESKVARAAHEKCARDSGIEVARASKRTRRARMYARGDEKASGRKYNDDAHRELLKSGLYS
jgi:hypothetical protein